jgi:hypothetical protein
MDIGVTVCAESISTYNMGSHVRKVSPSLENTMKHQLANLDLMKN